MTALTGFAHRTNVKHVELTSEHAMGNLIDIKPSLQLDYLSTTPLTKSNQNYDQYYLISRQLMML